MLELPASEIGMRAPRVSFFLISPFFLLLIVLQVQEIVLLVHESKKEVSYDRSRVEETEGNVRKGARKVEGSRDG